MTKRAIAKEQNASHHLAEKISELAIEKKAEDVLIMDMREIAGFTDYFVIMTGNSDTHIRTLSDHIEKELSRYKVKIWHKEGYENLKWVLMDYIDVIVHIFDVQTRSYYDLETLWSDAEKILVRDDA
ncbi:MAG: ribosome silencing factor [Candidatus Neomarinimicrobiota bacterium]|jgi:ribosome-associated protein|nr:ribosome silencing factor [Candidatus Neomarinimicrobiota bacterium]MDD3966912.1 ribosome silencing factor [Candidatus Neomarinimicrobiota bacterium]MDX9779820.1 ribosome silencing factor [bacterium]